MATSGRMSRRSPLSAGALKTTLAAASTAASMALWSVAAMEQGVAWRRAAAGVAMATWVIGASTAAMGVAVDTAESGTTVAIPTALVPALRNSMTMVPAQQTLRGSVIIAVEMLMVLALECFHGSRY